MSLPPARPPAASSAFARRLIGSASSSSAAAGAAYAPRRPPPPPALLLLSPPPASPPRLPRPLPRLAPASFSSSSSSPFRPSPPPTAPRRRRILDRRDPGRSLGTPSYAAAGGGSAPAPPADWERWLDSHECDDVWSEADLPPLDGGRSPKLDVETRFLLSLLEDEADGVRRGADRPTTALCNWAIRRLRWEKPPEPADGDGAEADPTVPSGRAARASAILLRMETCSRAAASRLGRGVLPSHPPPSPDHATYLGAMKVYCEERGPAHVAEGAEGVVERMKRMAEETGDEGLRPVPSVWNQALKCWEVSTDPDRAVRAAAFLRRIKSEGMGAANASSYMHVFQVCALPDDDDRSRRLGAEVALRVWGDFKRSGLKAPPHLYEQLFRACSYIKGGEGQKDKDAVGRRDRTVEEAFARCCEEGCVNRPVLQQLWHTGLAEKLLGERAKFAHRIPGEWDVNVLKGLPAKWTKKGPLSTH